MLFRSKQALGPEDGRRPLGGRQGFLCPPYTPHGSAPGEAASAVLPGGLLDLGGAVLFQSEGGSLRQFRQGLEALRARIEGAAPAFPAVGGVPLGRQGAGDVALRAAEAPGGVRWRPRAATLFPSPPRSRNGRSHGKTRASHPFSADAAGSWIASRHEIDIIEGAEGRLWWRDLPLAGTSRSPICGARCRADWPRMSRAKDLLRNTSDPVRDWRSRWGSRGASHFIRSFRQLEGMSPLK